MGECKSGVCKNGVGMGMRWCVYEWAGVCVGFEKCMGVVCWSWRCIVSLCCL